MLHNIRKNIQQELPTTGESLEKEKEDMKSKFETVWKEKVETEQLDTSSKKTTTNKFRKTRKYTGVSTSIINGSNSMYGSKSKTKSNSFLNEDMLNASAAFNQLKKKNINFLS